MKTYWDGEECEVKKVRVIVGPALRPTWWCANLAGQEREVLKITSGGESFYVDDEPGVWKKITVGRGMWNGGSHKSVPVEREL